VNGCKVNQFKNDITSLQADVSWVDQGRDESRSQVTLERDFGLRIYIHIYIYIYVYSLSNAVLLISAGAIDGHFEGKTPRECHQGGLVLARQFPGSSGNCNPEEK